jgi:hypothetical protein
MTARSWLSALTLVSLAGACGGSPEPSAKAPTKARTTAEKAPPPLPELDVMKVARALRGHEVGLRDCFANEGEPVRGFMKLAFEVEGSGAVSNIEVETSSFAEPTVAMCLSEKIGALHFDAPGKKQKTQWTFVSGLYEKPDEDDRSAKKGRKKKQKRDESTEQGVVIEPKSRGSLEPEEIEEVVHAGFGLRHGHRRRPRNIHGHGVHRKLDRRGRGRSDGSRQLCHGRVVPARAVFLSAGQDDRRRRARQ